MECGGRGSCHESTIIANYVDCSGAFGCESATKISATTVMADGYAGIESATLESDSTDITTMTVYSRGLNSGKDATFTCKSGTTCNLICDDNGCLDMDYICESGATCTYSCSGAGIDCPTYTEL